MERTKITPRHLLLILFPVAAALLGGLLFSGDLKNFMQNPHGGGISQAQLYLAISLLCGLIAFGWHCFPKSANWGILIFSPLVLAFLAIMQMGAMQSLLLLFLLNLVFTIGLWGVLQLTFFSKLLIRIRTAGFAILAALLLTGYFRILFVIMHLTFLKSAWSSYFWNSLFLFIFIGVGLSFADVIIIRKEVDEAKATQRHLDLEDEEDDVN